MIESNLQIRNWNLTRWDINHILNMIHGYEKNNIYVGDYIKINGIWYRFANFTDHSAQLVPDRCIARSKSDFCKVIKKPYEESYIQKIVLPRVLREKNCYNTLPIIDARLMSVKDIHTLPLFNLNKDYIRAMYNDSYLLSDIKSKYAYLQVNKDGNITTINADAVHGIRPIITIGYTVYYNIRG